MHRMIETLEKTIEDMSDQATMMSLRLAAKQCMPLQQQDNYTILIRDYKIFIAYLRLVVGGLKAEYPNAA